MVGFPRITAVVVTLALVAPLPLFAGRTDMDAMAADLQRVLGPGHVEISGVAPIDPADVRPASTFEKAVVDDMNRERAARGLEPLRINPRLSQAAGDRATDMFSKHYFQHVSPDGISPFSW